MTDLWEPNGPLPQSPTALWAEAPRGIYVWIRIARPARVEVSVNGLTVVPWIGVASFVPWSKVSGIRASPPGLVVMDRDDGPSVYLDRSHLPRHDQGPARLYRTALLNRAWSLAQAAGAARSGDA
jgi:hypothetical protein